MLAWVINLIKWNAGHTHYHFVNTSVQFGDDDQQKLSVRGYVDSKGDENKTLSGRW